MHTKYNKNITFQPCVAGLFCSATFAPQKSAETANKKIDPVYEITYEAEKLFAVYSKSYYC
jgi:hypothetical protein